MIIDDQAQIYWTARLISFCLGLDVQDDPSKIDF